GVRTSIGRGRRRGGPSWGRRGGRGRARRGGRLVVRGVSIPRGVPRDGYRERGDRLRGGGGARRGRGRPLARKRPAFRAPRAGRLVKEAPKQGVPGVTRTAARAGAPGAPGTMNPAIAKPAPAPGARRDGRTRGAALEGPGGERHGKQTFQLRSRKRGGGHK